MSTPHRLSEHEILDILALSENATAIYTDPDIIIQNANDAMISFWGKDRSIIGLPLEEAVPELKGQPFIGMLREVWYTGITKQGSSIAAELLVDGKMQTFYFDYKYRALKNEQGQTYAILHTASDVTERVTAKSALQKSENRFQEMVWQSPVAIAVLTGRDMVIETANEMMLKLWGKTRYVINQKLADALPELSDQRFLGLLDSVYTSGNAYHGSSTKVLLEYQGNIKQRYVDFVYQPMNDHEGKTDSIIVVATDVTELFERQQELERLYEQVRLARQAAQLGTFDMDLIKGTMYWDDRCRTLFGISHHDTVTFEKDFLYGLHPKDRDRISKIIENVFVKKLTNGEYDVEYRTIGFEDKKERWVRAKGKVFFDDQDIPLRFIGSVLDITEQKQDDIRKNDFIGMVSHELKTPLTSLKAYVQMLNMRARKQQDEFANNALNKVEKQIGKMSTMINGFLNVSRLESGKILLTPQDFILNDLLNEVVEEIRLTHESHSLIFEPCPPINVHADRDKIGQVVNNFLSNAIKYSPKGTSIEVTCHEADGMALVSVTDQGLGISAEDSKKLFGRFYRVQSNQTQTISGFGIGLYLSAEIIERHNGKIWVESEQGKGSTFYFTIPLAAK